MKVHPSCQQRAMRSCKAHHVQCPVCRAAYRNVTFKTRGIHFGPDWEKPSASTATFFLSVILGALMGCTICLYFLVAITPTLCYSIVCEYAKLHWKCEPVVHDYLLSPPVKASPALSPPISCSDRRLHPLLIACLIWMYTLLVVVGPYLWFTARYDWPSNEC